MFNVLKQIYAIGERKNCFTFPSKSFSREAEESFARSYVCWLLDEYRWPVTLYNIISIIFCNREDKKLGKNISTAICQRIVNIDYFDRKPLTLKAALFVMLDMFDEKSSLRINGSKFSLRILITTSRCRRTKERIRTNHNISSQFKSQIGRHKPNISSRTNYLDCRLATEYLL